MGGKEFSFWPTSSGAACGLGLLSVILYQRLSGANIFLREVCKAAFVQLVQKGRKKTLEIRVWEHVQCPFVQVQIAFGREQGEAR